MPQSRREFLQSAVALTGSAFAWGSLPASVERAFRIDPAENTTFLDAEHIVILMQENRSFDHCYGALQGVRGFRDPRAHVMPNGRKVWYQTDASGSTYAPFRLDMKGSNVTWVGGLPHSWPDQVDARNNGLNDQWLIAKARKDRPYALGFYTRADLPFYYALADAFTICDQAFCSSLTGTTPNRLYLWSGTIREDAGRPARVQNGDTTYSKEAAWTTFPERLQKAGVSWHVYQNELNIGSGLSGEEDSWLANFSDNPLEWVAQYRVRFAESRRRHVQNQINSLPGRIEELKTMVSQASDKTEMEKHNKELQSLSAQLATLQQEQADYNDETWAALDEETRELHRHAFGTNSADPDYRTLEPLTYEDGGEARTLNVPKGDTLHQFRADVREGRLPAVSWIVAPEAFSDHPSSAWFGAWYVSEVMNILTEDPEVWKKTIFILCYDENDGYFDHVPPFTAPHPMRPETGRCSEGINTAEDWSVEHRRDSSIGLGYRCPLVVASPWSRGGAVNSQVFDHTSVIQLMENWLEGRGTRVRERNISEWRRTVCGDMTSVFRPYQGEKYNLPKYLDRDETIVEVHRAKFLEPMAGVDPLSDAQIADHNVGLAQEPGVRPACPLPYELEANARVESGELTLTLEARRDRFGSRAAGAPFNVYVYGGQPAVRAYAVRAGGTLSDTLALEPQSEVRVDGPNGFMRHYQGFDGDVDIHIRSRGEKLEVRVNNQGRNAQEARLVDEAYGARTQSKLIAPGASHTFIIDPRANQGWYDFTVHFGNRRWQAAGHVETGRWSTTDPAMGRK